MAVRVAINGFGRIGRLAFRQMFQAEGFEIVAINDLTSPEMLAFLLKYDSSQGRYALADKVSCSDHSITVDGTEIEIYKELLRIEYIKALEQKVKLKIILDGTDGYASSFLNEAFSLLGNEFDADKVWNNLIIISEEVPKYIDKGEGITIEKDDTVIELIPKTGDFSRPVVKENAVLFNDVMDGVDVQYTLNQNGIEQSYIYRKYGSFETIPWKVEVKKAIASQRENQVLIHKMFQEDTIFTFSEATLFDSAGNSVALNTIFKHVFGGYQLTTNVDINWASEPQRAFPLRLKTNILAKENSLQVLAKT